MVDEITLNGKEYVLKSEALAPSRKRMGLMEQVNVMWIGRIGDGDIDKDGLLTHPYFSEQIQFYKQNGTLLDLTTDFNQDRITTRAGTVLSYEYYVKARIILKALTGSKVDSFEVWEVWNKEKSEFKHQFPVALVSHDYCFLIAPRIEVGSEAERVYEEEYKGVKDD